MSTKLLICLYCSLVVSCSNKQSQPSLEMIYSFIKSFTTNDEGPSFKSIKYLGESEIETEPWDVMYYKDSKVLSPEDLRFMQKQQKLRSDFKLDQNRINDIKILNASYLKGLKNREDFFHDFRSKYNAVEFGTISLPLFSIDNKKVLVRVCTHGQFHDAGAVFVFAKTDGKWKVVEQLSQWP